MTLPTGGEDIKKCAARHTASECSTGQAGLFAGEGLGPRPGYLPALFPD